MEKTVAIISFVLAFGISVIAWADPVYTPITEDNQVADVLDVVIQEAESVPQTKQATLRQIDAKIVRIQAAQTAATAKATALGAMVTKWQTIRDAVAVEAAKVALYIPGVAAFSCTPLEGSSPLEVTCTDESTGNVKAWQWVATDQEPVVQTGSSVPVVYTFPDAGVYSVRLTVRDVKDVDTVETRQSYIVVSE